MQTEIIDYERAIPNSPGYCVRLDDHEGYKKIIKSLPEVHPDFIAILAMRHKGRFKENPHFHLVITTSIKMQSFRVRLKKLFTLGKGNGHMSIKEWDGSERALSYLFHEEDPYIILQYGYSDEDMLRFMAMDEEVKDEYKKTKKNASSQREALIKMTIEALIADTQLYDKRKVNLAHQIVAYHVWDVCKDNQINLPHKFNLEHIIRTVQLHFAENGKQAWHGLKDSWYVEMFSFR